MSLKTLVGFAQEHFASLSGLPGDLISPEQASEKDAPQRPPRPPPPQWLQPPPSETVVGPNDGWKIDGPLNPQQPSPNVDDIGADALAFYLPFHFYRNDWGIYIRLSGVLYLARILKGTSLVPGDEPFLSAAERILFLHEFFHAATEIACTRVELLARRAIYQPYYPHRTGAPHEEALCNARAVLWADIGQPTLRRLEKWMSNQGPGYCDFPRWSSSSTFVRGLDRAVRFMTEALPPPRPKAGRPPHDFLFRGSHRYNIPTKRIDDLPKLPVVLIKPFPKEFGMQVFVNTNDHRPPHIHIEMPPGTPLSRYQWPGLVPLKGDAALSGRNKKLLDAYIGRHGSEIDERVRLVYAPR